jgi:hypothetical protein
MSRNIQTIIRPKQSPKLSPKAKNVSGLKLKARQKPSIKHNKLKSK